MPWELISHAAAIQARRATRVEPLVAFAQWISGNVECHTLAGFTSHAAQPVRIASTAEKIAGGSTKYLQLSAMPTTCKPKKTQPSAPIACGVFRAMVPRCQARN